MAHPTDPIAIVGAGIAGLVTAAVLRSHGIDCRLIEQTTRFGTVGAGIQLSPNGVRILQRLGLAPALAATAVTARSIETRRWDDASLLAHTPHGQACNDLFGAPYYLIHRADLQKCLLSALPADFVTLGTACARVVEHPDHAEIHHTDGSVTRARLVIGADGVHSTVRRAVVDDAPRFSGYAVHRGLVPADTVPSFRDDPRVLFWLGPGRHVTYYPIAGSSTVHFSAVGAVTTTPQHTTPPQHVNTPPRHAITPQHATTSRYDLPPHADPHDTASRAGTVEDLAAAFTGWHEEVRRVVTAARSVTRWGLFDRDIAPHYATGRVALVGDAAHPMLPYLSQGANQALEDAVVLAHCLADTHPHDPAPALRRYQALRHPRTAEIHRRARTLAHSFHLPDGAQQSARDTTLRATGDLAHLRWLYGYDAHAATDTSAATGAHAATSTPTAADRRLPTP